MKLYTYYFGAFAVTTSLSLFNAIYIHNNKTCRDIKNFFFDTYNNYMILPWMLTTIELLIKTNEIVRNYLVE